ncbi:MAG: radical SAM protein [Nanoarchaeota archaeon]|nr:radical SAM protein [Nanoarchaeota archaeon]
MNRKIQLEGHKLMYHIKEVAKWLNKEDVAPIYVEIGPINSCNHKCTFCALDYLQSKNAMMEKNVLTSNLKNMAEFGVKSIMFAGEGEPLIYPYLVDVIEKAKEFGLDIAITTNGVLFKENKIKLMLKNLSWIKFSIDAGTKKTYAKIHGCKEEDFTQVLENIKFACSFKKENNFDCRVGCQILLIPDNIEEVEELILKVKELGVDYLVFKPYSKHPDSVNELILNLDKYDKKLTELSERYTTNKFKVIYRNLSVQEIEKKEITYEKCFGINFFTLIDATGNVIPCNLFYDKPDFYYGNLNENTFEEIWKSERRSEVVDKLYKKGCVNCRKGCRLNFINKYLDIVMNKELEHINFI